MPYFTLQSPAGIFVLRWHRNRLFLNSADDPRHKNITVRERCSLQERNFPTWSMKEIFTERFPDHIKKKLHDSYPHEGDVLILSTHPATALTLGIDIYRISTTVEY
jgi:hypothetical protein